MKNAEFSAFYANESYDIASTVYYGLYALQHRGQEPAESL